MELHEFQILEGETCSRDHGIAVARASVGASAAKVSASVSTGSENRLVGAESMQGAVLHVQRDNSNTLPFVHDQVQSKVLDEEVGVVP